LSARAEFGTTEYSAKPPMSDRLLPYTSWALVETGYVASDRCDVSGDVGTERPPRRCAQPADPGVGRRSPQALPVGPVDRRRSNPDQHLVRGRRRRQHLVDTQRGR
jgi:hypothetical protein